MENCHVSKEVSICGLDECRKAYTPKVSQTLADPVAPFIRKESTVKNEVGSEKFPLCVKKGCDNKVLKIADVAINTDNCGCKVETSILSRLLSPAFREVKEKEECNVNMFLQIELEEFSVSDKEEGQLNDRLSPAIKQFSEKEKCDWINWDSNISKNKLNSVSQSLSNVHDKTDSSGNISAHKKAKGSSPFINGRKKIFTCNFCNSLFKNSSDLNEHLVSHTLENTDLSIHTGLKPLICNYCQKKFAQIRILNTHLESHTAERPHVCYECGKSFRKKNNLKQHIRIHTGHKPYVCSYCKKSFAQSGSLKEHVRIHTGHKPFVCNVCEMSFSQRSCFKSHLYLHMGYKPFVCEYCQKSFVKSDQLNRHLRTHDGHKPYICDHCGKSFARYDNLNTHLRTHTGERPYSCVHCNESFSHRVSLINHLSKHEKDK